MLEKRTLKDVEGRLEAARSSLTLAENAVASIKADEAAAVETSELYEAWRTRVADAEAEHRRLSMLVTSLTNEAQALRVAQDEEALRKRLAAQQKTNEALAKRIQKDLESIQTIAFSLIEAVCHAEIEDRAIDRILPEDVRRAPAANQIARSIADLPRVELTSREEDFWVFARNGGLVGDQDKVQALDEKRGFIPQVMGNSVKCLRKRFVVRQYHPAERVSHADRLYRFLRIPYADREGCAFDGERVERPQEALELLEHVRRTISAPAARPIETEMIPADDAKSVLEAAE